MIELAGVSVRHSTEKIRSLKELIVRGLTRSAGKRGRISRSWSGCSLRLSGWRWAKITRRHTLALDDGFGKTISYQAMKTRMSSKGQIVLPVELREQDSLQPGEEFTVERLDRGEYRLVRLLPRANEGVVDWLLACPRKGFFTPIESESTDTL